MIPPIIIVDDDESEPMIFDSVQEAEYYYEPQFIYVDVFSEDKVKVYDSLGYVLDITEGTNIVEYNFLFIKWKRRYKGVKLSKVVPEEKRKEELRRTLANYVVRTRRVSKEDVQNLTLDELIQKAD